MFDPLRACSHLLQRNHLYQLCCLLQLGQLTHPAGRPNVLLGGTRSLRNLCTLVVRSSCRLMACLWPMPLLQVGDSLAWAGGAVCE